MKTRIDIISGNTGAGKTVLIAKMLQNGRALGERAAVYRVENEGASALAGKLKLAIRQYRPARILLETTGDMLLEDMPTLLGSCGLQDVAYGGTAAFVMDGLDFYHDQALQPDYYYSQIKNASIVFVNRTAALSAQQKLDALGRIWAVNRHVHLMVEPLHGIDLWKVFDLPATSMDARNAKKQN